MAGNQVIYDNNNDGIPDLMKEVETDGLGNLVCTLYSNSIYESEIDISTVKEGTTIYWTTSEGKKVWHHQGTVTPTVPGHPNRS